MRPLLVLSFIAAASAHADELVLKRNLIATVMNSCRDVGGIDRYVYLAETVGIPPVVISSGRIGFNNYRVGVFVVDLQAFLQDLRIRQRRANGGPPCPGPPRP